MFFKKTSRAAITGFVSEIVFANFFVDQRIRQFHPEQRPGAGRKVSPAFFDSAGTAATAAPVSCEQVATTWS